MRRDEFPTWRIEDKDGVTWAFSPNWPVAAPGATVKGAIEAVQKLERLYQKELAEPTLPVIDGR